MIQNLLLSASRQYLLDTNALIYFLSGTQPYLDTLLPVFRRVQSGDASLIVSVLIEAELLVRPERNNDAEARERIADLLSEDGIYVVGVDRRIARRAAALRAIVKKPQKVGLPDAIIVATAIETGCDAIVGNDADWRGWTQDVPYVHLDDEVNNR